MKLKTVPGSLFNSNRPYRYIFLFLVLGGIIGTIQAQCPPLNKEIFHNGEQIDYDIYFKWGLLNPKAGQATFNMSRTSFAEENNVWNYNLTFRTNGMFEKIYRMRDTLECFISSDMQLIYSSKRTNEKNYYLIENIDFTHSGNSTRTHTHRYNMERTRIDTTIVTPGCVFDMVATSMYLRSISWDNIQIGQEFPAKVAIGRDIVNISFRYMGQAIVERNENLKYSTRYFIVDIFDDAFEVSKVAAEVWIGDDANHVPVKVKAKLKIGAAEVYYNNSRNLKFPLSSRVVLNR